MRFLIILLALVLTTTACGDPAGPGNGDFVFTPVPYKTITDGRPVFVDDECDAYIADEILVTTSKENLGEVESLLDGAGFSIADRRALVVRDGWWLVVKVPAGSVPDALDLLGQVDAVESAEGNFLLGDDLGESLFGCRETVK